MSALDRRRLTINSGLKSNRFDPATHCGPRRCRESTPPAQFRKINGGNKAVGDTALAHMRDQCIDRRLPFRLGDARGNIVVSNDACITLRKRDKNQNSGFDLFLSQSRDF